MEKSFFKKLIVVVAALLLITALMIEYRRSVNLQQKVTTLQQQQEQLAIEHKKVLEENNMLLKKELLRKYVHYIIRLKEKISATHNISADDEKLFVERSTYLIDNLKELELTPEEAKLHLSLIAAIKDIIVAKHSSENSVESKKD